MTGRIGSVDGNGSAVAVPITALRDSDSPRLAGLNREHASAMAELEAELPRILVNRATMRVMDGMHRLRAEWLRLAGDLESKERDETPRASSW